MTVTLRPASETSYPEIATLSVDAPHAIATLVGVADVTCGFTGAVGPDAIALCSARGTCDADRDEEEDGCDERHRALGGDS